MPDAFCAAFAGKKQEQHRRRAGNSSRVKQARNKAVRLNIKDKTPKRHLQTHHTVSHRAFLSVCTLEYPCRGCCKQGANQRCQMPASCSDPSRSLAPRAAFTLITQLPPLCWHAAGQEEYRQHIPLSAFKRPCTHRVWALPSRCTPVAKAEEQVSFVPNFQ